MILPYTNFKAASKALKRDTGTFLGKRAVRVGLYADP